MYKVKKKQKNKKETINKSKNNLTQKISPIRFKKKTQIKNNNRQFTTMSVMESDVIHQTLVGG